MCCDKWIMDAEHFDTKEHKRRERGWTDSGEHAGGGESELAGDSGAPVSETRDSVCSAVAQRSPEVRVFYPTWFSTVTMWMEHSWLIRFII